MIESLVFCISVFETKDIQSLNFEWFFFHLGSGRVALKNSCTENYRRASIWIFPMCYNSKVTIHQELQHLMVYKFSSVFEFLEDIKRENKLIKKFVLMPWCATFLYHFIMQFFFYFFQLPPMMVHNKSYFKWNT